MRLSFWLTVWALRYAAVSARGVALTQHALLAGPRDADYDDHVTLFSPQGRLYQVEYALHCAQAASGRTSVAVCGAETCALVTQRRAAATPRERAARRSRLAQNVDAAASDVGGVLDGDGDGDGDGASGMGDDEVVDWLSVSHVYRVAGGIGVVMTGLPDDERMQVAHLRRDAAEFKRRNGHDVPARTLAARAADASQERTQRALPRPLANVALLASVGTESGAPRPEL